MTRKNELRCAWCGAFLGGAGTMAGIVCAIAPSPLWLALSVPLLGSGIGLVCIASRAADKRLEGRKP